MSPTCYSYYIQTITLFLHNNGYHMVCNTILFDKTFCLSHFGQVLFKDSSQIFNAYSAVFELI